MSSPRHETVALNAQVLIDLEARLYLIFLPPVWQHVSVVHGPSPTGGDCVVICLQ